jgi:transcription factor TFIIIB component B''
VKSAGYDPDRPWDKEEALFAEAKKDMARIQAEDRGAIFDENGEMVGEADEGSQMGDPMDLELDPIDEVEEEEGGEDEQAEEAVPDGEGGEAGGEEGEENEGGNESLFLPGATSP